jgi:hypothetical protein
LLSFIFVFTSIGAETVLERAKRKLEYVSCPQARILLLGKSFALMVLEHLPPLMMLWMHKKGAFERCK